MTSRLAFLPLVLAATALSGAIAHVGSPSVPTAAPAASPRPGGVPVSLAASAATAAAAADVRASEVVALEGRLVERVRAFNGMSGIAIKSVDEGWEANWRGDRLFPQQSVSKTWVALTVLDKADKGQLDLNRRVTIARDDLTLWSSGTTARVLKNGGWTASIDQLLFEAITKSDNHANDKLMWTAGGPQAVRDTLAAKGIDQIRFYEGERALQSKIAGLSWSSSYSVGNNFNAARARVPADKRLSAFNTYIEDPYDGAAPMGIARALARLEKGELLSPASTAKMLTTMGMTSTGKLRVRGGLKAGWSWSHKTGTGQNYRGRVGGLNDVGLLTAPDGSSYAIAVMTIPNDTTGAAQELMRDVARMVIAHHEQHGSQGISF